MLNSAVRLEKFSELFVSFILPCQWLLNFSSNGCKPQGGSRWKSFKLFPSRPDAGRASMCVSSNSQGSAIWLNLRRNAGVCGSSTAICFSRVFSSAALFYALWLIAAVYKLVFLKKLFIALKLTAQALKLKQTDKIRAITLVQFGDLVSAWTCGAGALWVIPDLSVAWAATVLSSVRS